MNLTGSKKYSHGPYAFELKTPSYEIPIWGHPIGELRLIEGRGDPIDEMKWYMEDNDILVTTFRGEENTQVIRTLNKLGFEFVATYSIVTCIKRDFIKMPVKSDGVIRATKDDYQGMVSIKEKVFDYSTHQVDPALVRETTTYRNACRLKSYFNNPNHIAYVMKDGDVVIGYLQFVVNGDFAFTANGAIHPDYQGIGLGAKIYSQAFQNMFNQGVKVIESGYCNQNGSARKLHEASGFRVKNHEIHLRLFL